MNPITSELSGLGRVSTVLDAATCVILVCGDLGELVEVDGVVLLHLSPALAVALLHIGQAKTRET
jgi:hypothetical protein